MLAELGQLMGKRVAEVQMFSDFLTRYKSQSGTAPAPAEKTAN